MKKKVREREREDVGYETLDQVRAGGGIVPLLNDVAQHPHQRDRLLLREPFLPEQLNKLERVEVVVPQRPGRRLKAAMLELELLELLHNLGPLFRSLRYRWSEE